MKQGLLILICLLLTCTLAFAESTSSDILPPSSQSSSLLSENTSASENRQDRQNSPDSVLDTPLYESTQQFMDILAENNRPCVYRGKQGPNSESVYASFQGNNTTLNTVAVFSDTETDCMIYVLRFVNFSGKNPDLVSPLLDALNADYRFAKFYSAPNQTVSVTLDLLFPTGSAGQVCYDGLRRLLNICDECYLALSASISDLPDEGSSTATAVSTSTASTSKTTSSSAVSTRPDQMEIPDEDTEVPSSKTSTSASSVKTDEDDSASAENSGVVMKIKIRNGNPINVRKEPNQNSILLGTVEGGAILDCVGKADNGWYEILYYNGIHGFISGKRVIEMK